MPEVKVDSEQLSETEETKMEEMEEQNPEDMQQLKENANENEHIEVRNAEVVERPENTEMDSEVTEEEYEH